MKIISCFNTQKVFDLKRRFTFMAESFDKSFDKVVETTAKIADNSETNLDFKDYQLNATNATLGVIEGVVSERISSTQKKIDDVNDKISKLPKGSPQLKKLEGEKSALETEKKDLDSDQGALRKSLVEAQQTALTRLQTRFEDANKKREEAAKQFAEESSKSLQASLLTAKLEERTTEASWDNVAGMVEKSDLNFHRMGDVQMPSWRPIEGGGIVDANKGSLKWNAGQVKEATTEILQNIYIEQGKEAAERKLAELVAVHDTGLGHATFGNDVNYFVLDKAFGAGGRGSFRYVLDTMYFDTNKGPKLFGEVVGKMQAANEIFSDEKFADKFKKYQLDVEKAVHDGKPVPSPTEWAKLNAPEAVIKPADATALIGSVLERIKIPEQNIIYGVENPNYQAALKRRQAIEWHLRGALSAEPDSKKWDGLVKQALAEMLGQEPDKMNVNDLNTFDYTKINAGREIYGDAKDMLPEKFLYANAGLIRGLHATWDGKEVEITANGETKKVNFVAQYKEFLVKEMSEGGVVYNAIDKADRGRNKKLTSLIAEYSGKEIPKEKLDALNSEYEVSIRDIMRTKLKKPGALWLELNPEKKVDAPVKPDVPVEDDKSKSKGKKTQVGSKPAESKGGEAAPKKPAATPKEGGGDKKAPAGQPVAKGGDKKPDAPVAKVDAPAAPVDAVVAVEIPPAVKQQVTKIVTDVAGMPRPIGGWKPADAQATLDAGVAGLPEGLVKLGDKPLRFKSSRMEIEVSADAKGKYQGKIVAASPEVKKKYGFGDDVPVIVPPEKPDKKVAGKKDKSTEAAT